MSVWTAGVKPVLIWKSAAFHAAACKGVVGKEQDRAKIEEVREDHVADG